MSDTPIYDELIAERHGRQPSDFDGHDAWDESDEARQAYARGVAEAAETEIEFWGRKLSTRRRRRRTTQRAGAASGH
jgi:hypothetical protein